MILNLKHIFDRDFLDHLLKRVFNTSTFDDTFCFLLPFGQDSCLKEFQNIIWARILEVIVAEESLAEVALIQRDGLVKFIIVFFQISVKNLGDKKISYLLTIEFGKSIFFNNIRCTLSRDAGIFILVFSRIREIFLELLVLI